MAGVVKETHSKVTLKVHLRDQNEVPTVLQAGKEQVQSGSVWLVQGTERRLVGPD